MTNTGRQPPQTRWPIEGMGLSATRISEPMRRDRLLLVSAFAMALLTTLGTVVPDQNLTSFLLKKQSFYRPRHTLAQDRRAARA